MLVCAGPTIAPLVAITTTTSRRGPRRRHVQVWVCYETGCLSFRDTMIGNGNACNGCEQEANSRSFGKTGYSPEYIDEVLHKKRAERHAQSQTLAIDLHRPTFIKVNRKYLHPDTLDHYGLPWEWDAVRTTLWFALLQRHVTQVARLFCLYPFVRFQPPNKASSMFVCVMRRKANTVCSSFPWYSATKNSSSSRNTSTTHCKTSCSSIHAG